MHPIGARAGRKSLQVMEGLVDLIGRTLGIEPAEVRRRNMVEASEMPYRQRYPLSRRRASGV